MTDASISEKTQLLRAWSGGDERALKQLIPRVYRELRRLAGHVLKNERSGQTLQATDLVHEAYLKLVDIKQLDWRHRAHFFAMSATIMRRIVIDRARKRVTAKRGGNLSTVNLDNGLELSMGRSQELIAVDDALKALAEADPRKARIVELRFFVGLSVQENGRSRRRFSSNRNAGLESGARLAVEPDPASIDDPGFLIRDLAVLFPWIPRASKPRS